MMWEVADALCGFHRGQGCCRALGESSIEGVCPLVATGL